MSSDNGIYILPTKEGYYIKELCAIENIDFCKACEGFCKCNTELTYISNARRMFKGAFCSKTMNTALLIAKTLEDFAIEEYGYPTEYGTRVLVRINTYLFDSLIERIKQL